MNSTINKRDRSPKFPYITLSVALERISSLYLSARGNWVRLSDAADDWGLSPTSSSTLRNAAALLGYGLIEDESSGDSRRIRLTDNAQRIVGDARPGVKSKLLEEAALSSPIIMEYYDRWGSDRPNNQHAVSTLVYDSDFTERAAKIFLNVYDDALSFISTGLAEADENISSDEVTPANRPEEMLSQQADGSPLKSVDQAPTGAVTAESDMKRNSLASGDVWLKTQVGKDVVVSVSVSGEFGAKHLRSFIKLLETQLEIMEDD